jgi:hypothetical protein
LSISHSFICSCLDDTPNFFNVRTCGRVVASLGPILSLYLMKNSAGVRSPLQISIDSGKDTRHAP